MTETDFYRTLFEAGFADWYYAFCARYPTVPGAGSVQKGTRSEMLAYFAEADQPVKYDSKWRLYDLQLKSVGTIQCSASIFFQRYGLELTFAAVAGNDAWRSNLAVLAERVMQRHKPGVTVSPPYPRPDHGGNNLKLREIVLEFSHMMQRLAEEFTKNFGGPSA